MVLASVLASVAFCSCEDYERDNHGFPKEVILLGTGDTKIVAGDKGPLSIHIEGAEYEYKQDVDSAILRKDWLTVKFKPYDTRFELIAEPNATGKKREIGLRMEFGDSYGLMQAKQNINMAAKGR